MQIARLCSFADIKDTDMKRHLLLLIVATLLLIVVASPLHTVYGQEPSTSTSTSSSSSSPASSPSPSSSPSPIVPIIELSPDVPAAYALRVMICDTPLYDSPAGSVIPNTSVVIGQIFSVDPVDAIAADGTHWTQIFVGGWSNPFVPSVCVQ